MPPHTPSACPSGWTPLAALSLLLAVSLLAAVPHVAAQAAEPPATPDAPGAATPAALSADTPAAAPAAPPATPPVVPPAAAPARATPAAPPSPSPAQPAPPPAPPAPPAGATPEARPARAPAPAEALPYARRDEVQQFARELAQRQQLDPDWVAQQLTQARYVPAVARLIMPPPSGTPKNWAAYRARFVEPVRVRAGLAFWRAHEAWLTKAQAQYGVPAEIVVAIIGVETLYGQHMGNFRVLDALATLAFDFPPGRRDRSAFFRSELEQLLVLSSRAGLDPLSVRGSYAGAIGLPQFMPSSWNRDAVDFDGDGRIDLQRSPADAIGSVANFLAAHGWVRGMPTHFAVEPPADPVQRATLLAPDILPSFSAQQFDELGASLDEDGRGYAGNLALVALENGDAPPSFVAGTGNFYTITRYNWSSYYALSVIDLGATLAQARAERP